MADILSTFEKAVLRADAVLNSYTPGEPESDWKAAEAELENLTRAGAQLLAALHEPVKDILGKLTYEPCFPPPVVYDQERMT